MILRTSLRTVFLAVRRIPQFDESLADSAGPRETRDGAYRQREAFSPLDRTDNVEVHYALHRRAHKFVILGRQELVSCLMLTCPTCSRHLKLLASPLVLLCHLPPSSTAPIVFQFVQVQMTSSSCKKDKKTKTMDR